MRNQAVSTVKKSHAMMPPACARRHSVQLGPVRRGAGPSRAVRSRVRIVVAPTRISELAQLASDPHAAPARVLPGKPEDELTDLGIDRGSSWPTGPAVCPLSLHQLAMPPEEGRRGDEEGGLAVPRDRSARRREEHPVDGPELRWAARPPQDPELMAEDENLEILRTIVQATGDEEDARAPGPWGTGETASAHPTMRPDRESGFPTPTRWRLRRRIGLKRQHLIEEMTS